jgi:Glycosyl hydrolase family 9./N-terminal ig-like domain of cellulase.
MKIIRSGLMMLTLLLFITACGEKAEPVTEQEKTSEISISEKLEADTEIASPSDTEKTSSSDAENVSEVVVMINQLGQRPQDQKLVVVKTDVETTFSVINASTGNSVYDGELMDIVSDTDVAGKYKVGAFSQVIDEGNYYISCGAGDSGTFEIRSNIYEKLYQDTLDSVTAEIKSQNKSDDMDEYLLSEEKTLADLLNIYKNFEKSDNLKEDITKQLDKLIRLWDADSSDISKRTRFCYAAVLANAADIFKDDETVATENIKESAVNVWQSVIGEEGIPDISETADYCDVLYYAAVELYKIGEISSSELSDIDISGMNGGMNINDMSGYGMFSLVSSDESGTAADTAKKRLTEIIKERADKAEQYYFSAAYYGDKALPDAKDVCEQGMFFLMAEKVSDDQRVPILAKRQLDYLLGENDEGVCYIIKYGYHSVEKESEDIKDTALLYMLSSFTSDKEDSSEEKSGE